MSLSHSPQLNNSESKTRCDHSHDRVLNSMLMNKHFPYHSNYPQDNNKRVKYASLPNVVQGDSFAGSKNPKRKISVKKHTEDAK
eukprot:2031190-Ditylum_brightwellii.AAC.1